MNDFQTIADRVEIAALQAEFTDAGTQRDVERLLSLFTVDGAWRMPHIPADFESREEIRAAVDRLWPMWEFFVQNAHPGFIALDGDTATGRTYIHEFGRLRDGTPVQNYAIYHDRYARTPDGWRFTERRYEVKYLDDTPLPGGPPEH
jgi:ketosteroid isomerase-like protein